LLTKANTASIDSATFLGITGEFDKAEVEEAFRRMLGRYGALSYAGDPHANRIILGTT
jgi:hypothetical protein